MSTLSKPRNIIHLDLDAFFASVEELLDPAIMGQPILVGGDPQGRGVVASASYAARAYGVHSAMPMSQALRLCPQAIVRSGRHSLYADYSHQVMTILAKYTPSLEQISIDEAFLDVSGTERLFGPVGELARRIQQRIQLELSLPASLGVAGNKLVAKIASTLSKPHGLLIVPVGEEAAFLEPLPVERLWGVGETTARHLHTYGIQTIGQLATQPLPRMKTLFGAAAEEMHRRALGIDDSPVTSDWQRKSVSQERTFSRDMGDLQELRQSLLSMSETVASYLRRDGECARVVVLKLRYPDFRTITRRVTLAQPSDLTEVLYEQAAQLLQREWKNGMRVRLLGVGATGLTHARQLGLFSDETERLGKLSQTVDKIRDKYGKNAIRRASLLKQRKKDTPDQQ